MRLTQEGPFYLFKEIKNRICFLELDFFKFILNIKKPIKFEETNPGLNNIISNK